MEVKGRYTFHFISAIMSVAQMSKEPRFPLKLECSRNRESLPYFRRWYNLNTRTATSNGEVDNVEINTATWNKPSDDDQHNQA